MVTLLTPTNAELRNESKLTPMPPIGIEAASTSMKILRLAGYCAVVAGGNECDSAIVRVNTVKIRNQHFKKQIKL